MGGRGDKSVEWLPGFGAIDSNDHSMVINFASRAYGSAWEDQGCKPRSGPDKPQRATSTAKIATGDLSLIVDTFGFPSGRGAWKLNRKEGAILSKKSVNVAGQVHVHTHNLSVIVDGVCLSLRGRGYGILKG